MNPIQKILCPVDFSETSMQAYEYAQAMAQATNAEFVLAHAFDRPATLDYDGQTKPADKEIHEQLKAIPSQVTATRILHAGRAGEVICWLAQENRCDLIIMGTHGRTGVKHLLFGSTAEYVLQHARCPVLTVRQRPDDEPPLKEPMVIPLPAPWMM